MDMRGLDGVAGAVEVGHRPSDASDPMEAASGQGAIPKAQLEQGRSPVGHRCRLVEPSTGKLGVGPYTATSRLQPGVGNPTRDRLGSFTRTAADQVVHRRSIDADGQVEPVEKRA
jgi:hypothetical protein